MRCELFLPLEDKTGTFSDGGTVFSYQHGIFGSDFMLHNDRGRLSYRVGSSHIEIVGVKVVGWQPFYAKEAVEVIVDGHSFGPYKNTGEIKDTALRRIVELGLGASTAEVKRREAALRAERAATLRQLPK